MVLVQSGDIQAYEVLYERLKISLYNYVRNSVGTDNEAMELVQDTFVKVYKNRMMYRTEYKVSTWIWTLARNNTIDLLRKKDPLKFSESEDLNEGQLLDSVADNAESLDDMLDGKIKKEILLKCFEGLNPNHKEALNLRIFSESSYDEIAEIMNKTVSSVKALLNKGKKALKICVEKCMGESHE
jgi:RNA polymerase sigma-70 factor (ECF subfamily)